MSDHMTGFEIAIVGMAGRFPGANGIEAFWDNLRNGVESVSFFTDEELVAAGVDPAAAASPDYIKAGAVLEDIDMFDAAFFGISPREAEIMDPQHRLLLECAWEAFENAGYHIEKYNGLVGVYAGVGMNTYLLNNILAHHGKNDALSGLPFLTGNDKDHVPTRVSYKLNLDGPSVNVQTACSTSLVATHLACQALLAGECDMALAGGVSISVPQKTGYHYQKQGIYSPDGHCRAFDAKAEGTVGGNGVAAVVLKRLETAIADGDHIFAVIKGSAINNDGAAKIGYTAPGIDGQTKVIRRALAMAEVDPETVGYIETHGTGTPLGDPIEIEALTRAFRASTDRKQFCAVGALKTNVGHLDAAAGVAGLIKTALALYYGELPPSLNYDEPNPKIDFANSPFFVNTKLTKWASGTSPRRAGVSSFGMGGTNAHVILEETGVRERGSGGAGEQGREGVGDGHKSPPGRGRGGLENTATTTAKSRQYQLILLSAKNENALDSATVNLAAYLKAHPEQDLADIAFTLQTGRKPFSHRRMLVCATREDAMKVLADSGKLQTGFCGDSKPEVAFMFTGQGAQYVNMGKGLYESEPVFREEVDRCCGILQPLMGFDLPAVLYPELFGAERRGVHSHAERGNENYPPGTSPLAPLQRGETAAEKLKQTVVTQPALFVIEYALAQLWLSWGIVPKAMIGHSIGEYVAACLSGVFSLEDALALVAKRGQLMQDLPAGAMLSVPLPRAELEPLLDGQIDIAAVNEIKSCVVSGTFEAISAFEKTLQEKGITGRRLMTSHAFHSAMMDGILEEFTTAVGEIELHKPEIPYISNVTGAWITTEQATDPAYYAKHLRQAVLFADGVKTLLEAPNRVLLEVGPGRTLATLAKRQITRASHQQVLHTLRHPQVTEHDRKFILQTLGLLWLAGCDIPPGPPSKGGIDWHGFYKDEKRRRVPLPAYPFERQRYWIEPGDALSQRNGRNTSLQKKPDITDWFYVPTWKRSASISDFGMRNAEWKNQLTPNFEIQNPHSGRWLIFVDANGLGTRLAERLKENRQNVIIVQQGDAFKETAPGVYCIDSHKRKDYFALVNRLAGQEELPNRIVHLWSMQAMNARLSDSAKRDDAQQHGFYSLLYLTQALTDVQAAHKIQLAIVTGNVFEVTGDEQLVPEGATTTGLCKVIPLEYPHITCRNIDVVVPESGQWPARLVENIIHEHVQDSSDAVVAYRGKHRWVQSFEPVRLLEKAGPPARLRKNGVYLITGGPGGVGLEIAFYLAEAVQAKVVLVGRAQLPQRSTWEKWLTEHDGNDATARKIKKVQVIEAAGGEVIAVSADVSNMKQMQAAINQAEKRFGTIHGVIHAAGVGGGGVIQRQSRENIAAVFAPKIYGTRVLDALFREKNLDFMVLCSSLLSINGYPGRAEYAAANHFLDSFAHSRNSDDGTYTVSINWDNWREVGMGVDYLQREVEDGMLSREGVEAFKRVLDCDCPQVAVSMYDLNAMNIVQNVDRANGRPEQKTKTETPSAKHPRPALASAYVAPRSEIEKTLADAWCETLGIDKIGVHDNFFELGGDSVLMIQIIALVGKKGLRLSANQVFDHPTVAELAQVVGYGQGSTAEQGLVSGELPLTPIQHWFFEQNFPEPQHFNLPMLLELQQPAAFSLLEQAVNHLARHHDTLRLRFVREKSGVRQFHSHPEENIPCNRFDLSGLSPAKQDEAMRKEAAKLQAGLDFENGPMICVALFEFGAKKPARVLIIAHHLLVDVVSWRILLKDLQTILEQLGRGDAVQLANKTTSFKQWSEKLSEYAQSPAIASEGDFWLSLPWDRVCAIPKDKTSGENAQGQAASISVSLDARETQALLQEVPKAYNTQINDVLLAALGLAFSEWSGNQVLLVDLEAHGREDVIENVDLSRTVGWFTSVYPVLLTLTDAENPGETLKSVKEQLRRIPQKGIGYGLLRYLREEHTVESENPKSEIRNLKSLPQPEVSFLYMGQLDQAHARKPPFRMIRGESGPSCSPLAKRRHLIDIFGMVSEHCLQLEWMYGTHVHERATIENLAQSFLDQIRRLIAHCRSVESAEFTPSDFPGAKMDQAQLEELFAGLGKSGKK